MHLTTSSDNNSIPTRQLRRIIVWQGFMPALPILRKEIFLASLKRPAPGTIYFHLMPGVLEENAIFAPNADTPNSDVHKYT